MSIQRYKTRLGTYIYVYLEAHTQTSLEKITERQQNGKMDLRVPLRMLTTYAVFPE